MIVGKAIYHLLTNATAITDIVGTRIYPEVAQQDGDLPYIVYNVSNNEPSDTKPEPSKLDTAEIEVHCYATSYSQAIDIAVAVRGALDRVKGTYNGVNVQSIQYINEVIDFDEPQRAYEVTADYEVRISRTDFEIAQGSPITGVELGQLSDVNVTGATDNQILSYDAASDTWVPAADAGGPDVLDDLSDVDTGEPEDNQMLAYQQGTWSAIYQDEIVLPIASVTGLQAELNTIPDALDDLDDVKIVGTPAEGDALVYQSGFWSRGTAGASTLGDLDDVNTTGAGVGSTIVYNGSTWEISGSELPSDDIYYHNRYLTEAAALRSGATETVELYYTAQADGDGLSESASSDTPTSGYDIRRKLYYAEKAQADPDTSADWTQFTAIADNTTFNNAKAALLAYLKERTGGTVPISLKMTWEEVAQAPAFTGLLNESYGSGAEAAYSTRRLNGNVTDCMVIRRASDSTTQNIGFDGSGNIDESAIETFCTGTTCTVVTWKDQSGNGNDATAAAPANEPTIYTGGALVKENGKVAITFSQSTNFDAVNITGASSVDFFNVFSTTDTRYILNGGSGLWSFAAQDASTTVISSGFGTPSYRVNGTSASMTTRGEGYTTTATGNRMLLNAAGDSSTWSNYSIIYRSQTGDTFNLDGNLQEAIYFTTDKSSVRTSIESNIGDYFTQNTPLLDTYSGAAAAYSLRLLDSTYTGALVNVWNGTSYADIYPNVFGELDTVALAAHCGSNDGFIRYWYDQSGNTNTAAQTTTANMPKIYDGTTGVVTENGLAAMTITNGQGFTLSSGIGASTNKYAFIVHAVDSADTSWSFFGDSTAVEVIPLAQDGNTGTSLASAGFLPINAIYKDGSALSVTTRDDLHAAYTSAGQSLTVMDFEGSAGIGIMFNRGGGRDYSGTAQAVIIYDADKSANRTNIEDNINTFYSIY